MQYPMNSSHHLSFLSTQTFRLMSSQCLSFSVQIRRNTTNLERISWEQCPINPYHFHLRPKRRYKFDPVRLCISHPTPSFKALEKIPTDIHKQHSLAIPSAHSLPSWITILILIVRGNPSLAVSTFSLVLVRYPSSIWPRGLKFPVLVNPTETITLDKDQPATSMITLGNGDPRPSPPRGTLEIGSRNGRGTRKHEHSGAPRAEI
mmetsp:Transcript_16846/g.34844  ORF Transcript_16846/g.34844 Transcript_16846/m.34844 type:complete len:205 (-) Transcript_16846:864-1478(-)